MKTPTFPLTESTGHLSFLAIQHGHLAFMVSQLAIVRSVCWLLMLMLTAFSVPAATFIVTTTNDSGGSSLREAVTAANTNAGFDVIQFNIPGATAKSIVLRSALPPITDPLVIDGTTQPGFTDKPVIELNGESAEANANGLLITAGGCTIRGLAINRFVVDGIQIQTVGGNVIDGNFIGVDLNGTTDRGNGGRGIHIMGSSSNRIGGIVANARNIISGNAEAGILIEMGSRGNVIQGNFIGLNFSGELRVPNGNGIKLAGASNNRIGGTSPLERNVIAGNNDNGLLLVGGAKDNVVEGNYIGLAPTGEGLLGNGNQGVYISDAGSVRNRIGGTNGGSGNVIAGNGIAGIKVDDNASANALLGNSIFANDVLGINLGHDNVTPNDLRDVDSGGNRLQNYPVLHSVALFHGTLSVYGTLDSSANETFRIELFGSAVCDFSGYGEGQLFLGAVEVVSDDTGHASFDLAFAIPTNRFHFVTATATDAGNNTSEFSRSFLVGGTGCAIESTFDDPNHGWLVWYDNNTLHSSTWTNSGGNPDGYISRNDGGGDSKFAYWEASTLFLGDQAGIYGGYLEFDLKQSRADQQRDANDIVLIGSGLQLVLDTTLNPSTSWTPYRVFLHEAAGWRVGSLMGPIATERQLRTALRSLNVLRIRAEYRNGGDVDGLDNVRFIFPAPTLTMRKLADGLCVEWPLAGSCFQLESAESLTASAWLPVVAAIETTNGVHRLVMPSPTGIRFYRLNKLTLDRDSGSN